MRPTSYLLSNSRRNGCHLRPRLQCRASNSRGHGPTIIAKRLTDSETFWGVPEVLPGLFCTLTVSASASTCLTNLHQPFTYIFLRKRSHMSDTAIIFSLYHERYLGCCAYIQSWRPRRDFACMIFPSSLIITLRRGVCGCGMEGFCSRLHISRRRAWIPTRVQISARCVPFHVYIMSWPLALCCYSLDFSLSFPVLAAMLVADF